MILKNASYQELSEEIRKSGSRIIIYGAGTIGQVLAPYFIKKYELVGYIDCYVDINPQKHRKTVQIGSSEFRIESPDILYHTGKNVMLLITNSNFYPVIDFLDHIPALEQTKAYILPVMQLCEYPSPQALTIKHVTEKPVIPKIIHYTWFSNQPIPVFLQDCIKSWKTLCPDYEIIHWNADNYDTSRIPYVKEAIEQKRYGFAADAARLDILYRYGGIYMDVDVTLLKGLDDLLYQEAFIGMEKWGVVNIGGCCGAIQGHPMLKNLLDYRKDIHFVLETGNINTETSGKFETIPFTELGLELDNSLQRVQNVTIYPSGVFHPYDYMSHESQIFPYTISMHHFYGSWMEKADLAARKEAQRQYRQILKRMGR